MTPYVPVELKLVALSVLTALALQPNCQKISVAPDGQLTDCHY
jgi:hypothetical protein